MAEVCRFYFPHGVGDMSHALHLFELWKRRGHRLLIQVGQGREWAWRAAGFQVVESATVQHIFPEPMHAQSHLLHEPWDGSKCGRNLNPTGFSPLPWIGHPSEVWDELVNVHHDLSPHVSKEAKNKADELLAGLSGPIFVLHTRGVTSPELKNFPAEVETDTIHQLLEVGSVVLVDYEGKGPRIKSGRFKAINPASLEVLHELITRAACVVGCDSGVFHFARLTRTPRVGCFWGIPAWHCVLPSPQTVSLCQPHGNNSFKRFDFNMVTVPKITGEAVTKVVKQVLSPRRFCEAIGPDVVLQNMLPNCGHRNSNLTTVVDRHLSFGRVFEFLMDRTNPQVLETGCIRSVDDWGAGWFTALCGYLMKHLGGNLISVDLTPAHVKFAQEWTKKLPVKMVESDSVSFLAAYQGPTLDVLYLDSLDTEHPNHGEHCLAEARVGIPHLKDDGLLVIDDSPWDGEKWVGKGHIAIPKLVNEGWVHEFNGYQSILRRG